MQDPAGRLIYVYSAGLYIMYDDMNLQSKCKSHHNITEIYEIWEAGEISARTAKVMTSCITSDVSFLSMTESC